MNLLLRKSSKLTMAMLLVFSFCFMGQVDAGLQKQPGSAKRQKQLSPKIKKQDDGKQGHMEQLGDPQASTLRNSGTTPGFAFATGAATSVQVNVDGNGMNIVGDAANEPSIAVDPTDHNRMAIGWRQFDTINSNFRQAGNAFTTNAGATWNNNTVIDPGVFRSDPVLGFTTSGQFFYNSLTINPWSCDIYWSGNGGASWSGPAAAFGGDKQWMTIDRSNSIGNGNIYVQWNPYISGFDGCFTRSTDGGASYGDLMDLPIDIYWGTLSVGPDGELYICGTDGTSNAVVLRSDDAKDANATPTFPQAVSINLGGGVEFSEGPNPSGLLGQYWIATDHSTGPTRGNVYLLGTLNPPGNDPLDIFFSRSTDGGVSWSAPIRINSDPQGPNRFQWFGTMSVSPNGRIDVIWNDTRNDPNTLMTEMYYSSSTDGGLTWTPNVAVNLPWDPFLGYPNQNKIGDYYDMISDDCGVDIAYAATYNGEQDVYYMRIDVPKIIPPTTVDFFDGLLVGGGIPQLEWSDNDRMVGQPSLNPFELAERKIVIDMEATAQTSSPSAISFTLESHVNAVAAGVVMQSIELWDFNDEEYVEIDSRASTLTDSVAVGNAPGDVTRFVNPADNTMKTRITYRADSTLLFHLVGFFTQIDRAIWTVTP